MKKLILLFVAIVMIAVFSNSVNAQTVVQATSADAYIVTPLTITPGTGLDFGKLAVLGPLGTCVISPAQSPSRNATGGVNLVTSTYTSAAYIVGGEAGFTYDITLPAQPGITVLEQVGQVATMVVDLFTSTPSPTGQIGVGNTQNVYVGATLHVGAGQTPGQYKGTFNFTVNYN